MTIGASPLPDYWPVSAPSVGPYPTSCIDELLARRGKAAPPSQARAISVSELGPLWVPEVQWGIALTGASIRQVGFMPRARGEDRICALLRGTPFATPSGEAFEYFARAQPSALLAFLEERLVPDSRLTFAAEAAGLVEFPYHEKALDALERLWQGAAEVVREGIVLGAAGHMYNPDLPAQHIERARLLIQRALRDPSTAVRVTATNALTR